MTAISAGLAATIREWFSEGENITTVETAEKVDLLEVRVKRPQRTKVMQTSPSTEEADGSGSVEAAVAEAEPSDEMEAPQEEAEAPAPAVAAVMEVEQAEEEPVQAVVAAETVTPEPPVVVTKPPPAPEVETKKVEIEVLPAGPMLGKPKRLSSAATGGPCRGARAAGSPATSSASASATRRGNHRAPDIQKQGEGGGRGCPGRRRQEAG
jgi:hypothetical protein